MTDSRQIPFLIQLLDEDDDDIQLIAMNELASFGPNLSGELKKFAFALSPNQKDCLDYIFEGHRRVSLKRVWPSWRSLKTEEDRLESAVEMISRFLDSGRSSVPLGSMLDDIAALYRERYDTSHPRKLAHFLFRDMKIIGDEEDYYNPQNSNLFHVIREKRGIPISLACLYILVGRRLGIRVEACNFPGHFLARIQDHGRIRFVDCFSGGQLIDKADIVRMREDLTLNIDAILHEEVSAEMMIRRYLANMIQAYQLVDDEDNIDFLIELFRCLEDEMPDVLPPGFFGDITPEEIINAVHIQFLPGDVVRHSRYGYRGIVVDVDEDCEAAEDWYYSNQTQPGRDQPWYHVLVDGSDQVTYVAQENLTKEVQSKKIVHPLLSYFFIVRDDGSYVRNDNDWPEEDE